jgi:hypothetical protein
MVKCYHQIAVVAVMCKPHRCPHVSLTGNICVYCPGGPDSDFEYSTQSYTGYEPTSMRAIRARYDPYLQTRHRVQQVRIKISSLDQSHKQVSLAGAIGTLGGQGGVHCDGRNFHELAGGLQRLLHQKLARCSFWTQELLCGGSCAVS